MSLVFDLIDRVIDLARRREEVDRASYGDVVKSLMDDVDALHRDYLTSFRKYRDALVGKKELDSAFIDTVAADSLFSRDLRFRVQALAVSDVDPRLRTFMSAVKSYLQLATMNPLEEWDASVEFVFDDERIPVDFGDGPDAAPGDAADQEMALQLGQDLLLITRNPMRSYLAKGVERIARKRLKPELMVRLGLRLIESLVVELQRRYAVITRAHNNLRTRLLSPK